MVRSLVYVHKHTCKRIEAAFMLFESANKT